MAQRPSEIEFLADVLRDVRDLPPALVERLLRLIAENPDDRAEAIRRLIEEHGR
jgi:hypothetical protein